MNKNRVLRPRTRVQTSNPDDTENSDSSCSPESVQISKKTDKMDKSEKNRSTPKEREKKKKMYIFPEEDSNSSSELLNITTKVDKKEKIEEKNPRAGTPLSKINLIDLTTPRETPTRRITRRMSIESSPMVASPLRRSARIFESEERSDNRNILNKKCFVKVLNLKEDHLPEVAEEVNKDQSDDTLNTSNKKSESKIDINETSDHQNYLDGIPKVTTVIPEENSNDKFKDKGEIENQIFNETQKDNSLSDNKTLGQSKAVTFNESSGTDISTKKSYIKTPHSSKNDATNVRNNSTDDSFKELLNKENEKSHTSSNEDPMLDKQNYKNKLDKELINKITPNKKKGKFSLSSSTPLNTLKTSDDNFTSLSLDNNKPKSDQHTFPKFWNQAVHGKNAEKIDEINLVPEKFEVVKNKSTKYIPSSDEENEEAENEEIEKNEFIDDEALCSDGESMDEEERQYLKENEIPVGGISIGSEDSENISNEEERESECNSFVVSDCENELSDSAKFSEDDENIIKKDNKSMKKLSTSVISISDEEQGSFKRKKKISTVKQELDFSDKENSIRSNLSNSKSADKNEIVAGDESKLNEVTKSQTELNISDEEEQFEDNFQTEIERYHEMENYKYKNSNLEKNSSLSNIIASNKSSIESPKNISLTETNRNNKNEVNENLQLSRKIVLDSELAEENHDKSKSIISTLNTKRLSREACGVIEDDQVLKLQNDDSKKNNSNEKNEINNITTSQGQIIVISSEIETNSGEDMITDGSNQVIKKIVFSDYESCENENEAENHNHQLNLSKKAKSKDFKCTNLNKSNSKKRRNASENLEIEPTNENSNTNNGLNKLGSPKNQTESFLERNSSNYNENQNKSDNNQNVKDKDLNETISYNESESINKNYGANNIQDNKILRNNPKEIEVEGSSKSACKRKRYSEDYISGSDYEHKKQKTAEINESYTIEKRSCDDLNEFSFENSLVSYESNQQNKMESENEANDSSETKDNSDSETSFENNKKNEDGNETDIPYKQTVSDIVLSISKKKKNESNAPKNINIFGSEGYENNMLNKKKLNKNPKSPTLYEEVKKSKYDEIAKRKSLPASTSKENENFHKMESENEGNNSSETKQYSESSDSETSIENNKKNEDKNETDINYKKQTVNDTELSNSKKKKNESKSKNINIFEGEGYENNMLNKTKLNKNLKTPTLYEEVKKSKYDTIAKRKSLPASTSKENENLNKKKLSTSVEFSQIINSPEKSHKKTMSAYEDKFMPQSKKVFNSDPKSVVVIINRCDEILEKANQAKLKQKLLKQNTTSKVGVIGSSKKKKKEHGTKNKAIGKALLHSKKFLEERINYENKQTMKNRNGNNFERSLPPSVLKSISSKNSELIKDEGKTVLDLKNKNPKCKLSQRSEEKISSIISSSGSFQEEPVTPKRSKKAKKIISKLKLPSGTVFEEYLSPKENSKNGFIESEMTPKSLGYKVRRILSAGQEVPFKKEGKKIKKKIYLSEPVITLPKPTWTCSGDWFEQKLKNKEKISTTPVELNIKSSTKFSVSTLNSDKMNPRDYLNINKALDFKKSALKNNAIIRESTKDLLRRKQRQNINNKF